MRSEKERLDFYEKSLDRMNLWLQFVEAKHAAVIAFAIAVLSVIYEEKIDLDSGYKILLSIGYVISISISLASFVPIKRIDTKAEKGEHLETDNMIFWGDICKYSVESYMKKVHREIFGCPDRSSKKEEKFLSEEIIANYRIANRKYMLYRYSIFVAVFVTVLLPIFLLITA